MPEIKLKRVGGIFVNGNSLVVGITPECNALEWKEGSVLITTYDDGKIVIEKVEK